MDDDPADLREVSEVEAQLLEANGWTLGRLLTLSDLSQGDRAALAHQLRMKSGLEQLQDEIFEEHIQKLATRHSELWSIEARMPEAELLQASASACDRKRRKTFIEESQAMALSSLPRKGKAVQKRLPTKLARAQAKVGDDVALRDKAEKEERQRWASELKDIIAKSGMPASLMHLRGDLAQMRCAKGRRASTLRKHVKTWRIAERWFQSTFDENWPKSPQQVASYIAVRLEEPCARSVPESFYKTLMFLEHAGEVADGSRLSDSEAVKNMLEECRLQLESTELRAKRKARIIPVKVITAWEAFVMDEESCCYLRAFLWYKLVKLWTGMRYDDTRGVPNSTMSMGDECLVGEIHKSKTSGAGKRVNILKFYVSKKAWLLHRGWLETGWKVWNTLSRESGMEGRDFMLPAPTKDYMNFRRKLSTYAMTSAITQAVLGMLWYEVDGRRASLMFGGAGIAWTEHSERATLRTWSQSSRIPEDIRKQLGRWQATADEGYERGAKINILRSQQVMAEFVKSNRGREGPFGEEDVISYIVELMEGQGHPEPSVLEQAEQLRYFAGPLDWKDTVIRFKWSTTGPLDAVTVDPGDEAEAMDDEPEDDWNLEGKQAADDTRRLRGCYVCSIVGRSRTKTLHKVGECHRLPGIHYKDFEVLGEEAPCTSKYNKVCSACFPDAASKAELDLASSSDSDLSSSDSTGSEE
eukprot:Skav221043  [mRNA]  locus=scaffold1448:250657:252750:+ [translate_table: standard]